MIQFKPEYRFASVQQVVPTLTHDERRFIAAVYNRSDDAGPMASPDECHVTCDCAERLLLQALAQDKLSEQGAVMACAVLEKMKSVKEYA